MNEFDSLKLFVTVIESGGFNRAAKRLGISKSIVSRRIAQIEADLGARLLSRTTRGISPTDAGMEFKERAERILANYEEAWEAVAQRGDEVERRNVESDLGGTMRLGAYPCILTENSKLRDIYGSDAISERHRHRYEVNINYREALEKAGLLFSGLSPDGVLPEIVELPSHPWFVGVQFHPELKSKPLDPHPLFTSFVAAAVEQSRLV